MPAILPDLPSESAWVQMSSLGIGNHATSPAAIPNALGVSDWTLLMQETRMHRYESRSTIIISNRPLEDWGKLLSDVPTAGAMLGRFLHHAITAAIHGRSDRVKGFRPHGQKTGSLASQPKLQHRGARTGVRSSPSARFTTPPRH